MDIEEGHDKNIPAIIKYLLEARDTKITRLRIACHHFLTSKRSFFLALRDCYISSVRELS